VLSTETVLPHSNLLVDQSLASRGQSVQGQGIHFAACPCNQVHTTVPVYKVGAQLTLFVERFTLCLRT
jgi:hypothetical protein